MYVYRDTIRRMARRQDTTSGKEPTLERESHENLSRLLARAEVLGPLSEERALWLARRVPEMRFDLGGILWGPTQESNIVLVLLEGRVRLYKILGGTELTLEIIEAGQLFGHVSALAGQQRGTYAEALEPVRAAMLSRHVLDQLVREDPDVGLRLVEGLAAGLHEHHERLADVALKKVRARLASLFLRLLESEGVVSREGVGIRTRYTHEQLAAMVGSKRVAVSRAMSVKGRRVYLKDQAVLRRAAEEGGRRET